MDKGRFRPSKRRYKIILMLKPLPKANQNLAEGLRWSSVPLQEVGKSGELCIGRGMVITITLQNDVMLMRCHSLLLISEIALSIVSVLWYQTHCCWWAVRVLVVCLPNTASLSIKVHLYMYSYAMCRLDRHYVPGFSKRGSSHHA